MHTDRIWILVSRKLSGEANQTELQELGQLLDEHPNANEIITSLSEAWESKEQADQDFLEATYLLHLDRMKNEGHDIRKTDHDEPDQVYSINDEGKLTNRSRKLRFILFSLPILILIAFLSRTFIFRPASSDKTVVAELPNQISTKKGSKTQIQLPDGSKVWLNADSKLDYDKSFGVNLREIHLTGEAFFDVVKNAEKPFIVHTNTADIKVLGTAFNVRSYPADKTTETSLISGSVEVTLRKRPTEKWLLKPNEKLVLLNDNRVPSDELSEKKETIRIPLIAKKELTYQTGDTIAVEIAWTKNKLSFEDETFEEVALKLERWYDVEFEFRNPKLREVMLHNSFTNETLEQVLEALEFSLRFKHRVEGKKVIIY